MDSIQEKNMSDEKRRFFSDYMEKFERKVMIPCATGGVFSSLVMVSTRESKLKETDFGQFVGTAFEFEKKLAFNYYGLMKLSTGLIKKVQSVVNDGMDVKAAEALVIYFAAIKMKHITDFAPELATDFSDFKEYLVLLRGFPTKEKPISR